MGGAFEAGQVVSKLVARCHAGLDSMSIQWWLIGRLERIVPLDAAFCDSGTCNLALHERHPEGDAAGVDSTVLRQRTPR